MVVTANTPPKVAQMLARHSTITLTMDRYAHLGIVDLAEGLKRLPSLKKDNGDSGKTGLRPTGT